MRRNTRSGQGEGGDGRDEGDGPTRAGRDPTRAEAAAFAEVRLRDIAARPAAATTPQTAPSAHARCVRASLSGPAGSELVENGQLTLRSLMVRTKMSGLCS